MLHTFDLTKPWSVRRGDLPHWWQPGCATFITFRTLDSVPAVRQARHAERRRDWLRDRTGCPPLTGVAEMVGRLTGDELVDYASFSRRLVERDLDEGFGECPLRDPDLARVVADSLGHFDGGRYELADFVVMPNHVHALMAPIGSHSVEDACRSWKHFTAQELNRRLERTGHFWQGESFDHLVRSPEQLEATRRYIIDNPVKAGLSDGEFLLGVGRAYSDPLP